MNEQQLHEWLYARPDLLTECQCYADYCDRRESLDGEIPHMARKFQWMETRFLAAHRLPHVRLNRSLYFPQAERFSDLCESIFWYQPEQAYTSVKRKNRITKKFENVQVSNGYKGPPNGGYLLYYQELYHPSFKLAVIAKPELNQLISDYKTWKAEALSLYKYSDGCLLTLEVAVGSPWVAYFPLDCLNEIPAPPTATLENAS